MVKVYRTTGMDFKLLINRKIIDVLIGDVQVFETYSLPYLSGPRFVFVVYGFRTF